MLQPLSGAGITAVHAVYIHYTYPEFHTAQKDAFILEVRVQSAVQKLRPMATTQCMP